MIHLHVRLSTAFDQTRERPSVMREMMVARVVVLGLLEALGEHVLVFLAGDAYVNNYLMVVGHVGFEGPYSVFTTMAEINGI